MKTNIFKYWGQEKDTNSPQEKLKFAGRLLLTEKVRQNLKLIHTGYDILWFVYKHDDNKEYRYQVGWANVLETFQCLIKWEDMEKVTEPFNKALVPAITDIVRQIENDNHGK